MSEDGEIGPLVLAFLALSLVSVGGGIAVLPEMHRLVVEQHGWMDSLAFAKRFALAQAAPGPNIMVVGLIGWHVAGATGMFAAMLAMCGPTSLLAYAVARLRQRDLPWLRLVERGLVPIAVGLIAASGLLLAKGTVEEATLALPLAAACTVFVWRSSRSPLWVLVAGALYGALLL
ncbi:chromate transporter [Sabulicella glaciei]|uniref:Chromate transporter n=1 Tax=Sabulicella glaciei TaxID=2984948 RepID=A0ABT3NQU8_9PROT|nr:chromate transporter [Roseococcus sp. MDT2-1-1]MCW8084538.1 chromate transporter [Roseococcus sp. MDT2-1-1]